MFQPKLAQVPEHPALSDRMSYKPAYDKSKRACDGKSVSIRTVHTTGRCGFSRTLPPVHKDFRSNKTSTMDNETRPGSKVTNMESENVSGSNARKPLIPSPKKGKALFAGLGKKVTSMVRARMAFQGNKKKTDEILEADSMEAIHEMPKVPRFSSFLSPEAQYAMMMGYEDILHQQLASSHPEYCSVLRRNKTPMFRVGIVKIKKSRKKRTKHHADLEDSDSDLEEEMPRGEVKDGHRRLTTTTETKSMMSSSPTKPSSTRLVIPLDKRLRLTYRLESAMDILDTIRHRHGQPPISPRVRSKKRDIAPIRDYNSWTNVWKTEFLSSDKSGQKPELKT